MFRTTCSDELSFWMNLWGRFSSTDLGDRQPRTIPTKDLPYEVVFWGRWCELSRFCTRNADRWFCGRWCVDFAVRFWGLDSVTVWSLLCKSPFAPPPYPGEAPWMMPKRQACWGCRRSHDHLARGNKIHFEDVLMYMYSYWAWVHAPRTCFACMYSHLLQDKFQRKTRGMRRYYAYLTQNWRCSDFFTYVHVYWIRHSGPMRMYLFLLGGYVLVHHCIRRLSLCFGCAGCCRCSHGVYLVVHSKTVFQPASRLEKLREGLLGSSGGFGRKFPERGLDFLEVAYEHIYIYMGTGASGAAILAHFSFFPSFIVKNRVLEMLLRSPNFCFFLGGPSYKKHLFLQK